MAEEKHPVEVDVLLCEMVDFMTFGPLPPHEIDASELNVLASPVDEPAIHLINSKCRDISDAWSRRVAKEHQLKARLHAVRDKCEARSVILEKTDILNKYKHLCMLEAKEQLLKLHQSLHALRTCPDISNVSMLVADIVQCAPTALPTESTIFKLLSETTGAFCKRILSRFQTDFEEHLRQSSDAVHSHKLWISFLADAKGPIAAYVLLSILPMSLSATGSVVEAYEGSLDLVLMPMWSRLHFHLVTAREEGTMRQLLWTFQYAKNLVNTLSVFAADVMLDSYVCQLLKKSGHTVSSTFILRKVSRFMRAHLAVFIEVLSPLSKEAVLHIMESALEFDSVLRHQGLEELYVSEVVCEFKPALQLCLAADAEFMSCRMMATCPHARDNDERAFGMQFRRPFSAETKIIDRTTIEINCFKCVYEASWLLLHVCRQRYAYIPMQCEDDVVSAIIEPILCAALGLLLYRIRTHPTLVCLSKQVLPEIRSCDIKKTLMEPVSEILASVNYFNDVMSAVMAVESFSRLKCNKSRFEVKWKKMRSQLSAASMFSTSARQGAMSVQCIGDVITFAFSREELNINTAVKSITTPTMTGNNNNTPRPAKQLLQISLKDLLSFVGDQASLLCRGLVEQHEELLQKYKI